MKRVLAVGWGAGLKDPRAYSEMLAPTGNNVPQEAAGMVADYKLLCDFSPVTMVTAGPKHLEWGVGLMQPDLLKPHRPFPCGFSTSCLHFLIRPVLSLLSLICPGLGMREPAVLLSYLWGIELLGTSAHKVCEPHFSVCRTSVIQ